MKHKISTELIFLTVLTILAVSGWIYIYSCRDEVIMELQTITGDASCLSDKELYAQCHAETYVDNQRVWNLDIGFPYGPVVNNISYEIIAKTEYVWYEFSLDKIRTDSNEAYAISIRSLTSTWYDSLTAIQIKDESGPILDKYILEDIIVPHVFIDFSEYSRYFKMDGIVYFTLPNYRANLLRYIIVSQESKNNEVVINKSTLSYPVEYTAMSGIWAIDESSGSPPENVVPYFITGDSDSPKVCEIYAAEAESAIVLLTVENGVDLYATAYDTKTKTTHDPVLIFHSDSGNINPIISSENNTCPMGSIIVEIGSFATEKVAVALGKNEITGNIEPVCYEMPQEISLMNEYDFFNRYQFQSDSVIFYRGEEMWIISDVTDYYHRSDKELTQDSPNYPYSNLFVQQIRIVGVKEGVIFYEGLLSFDLTAADIESHVIYYGDSDCYDVKMNNNVAQIEFY